MINKSMRKVNRDYDKDPGFISVEICGSSRKAKNAHLYNTFTQLLVAGRVPEQFFLDLLEKEIEKFEAVFKKPEAAYRVLTSGLSWCESGVLANVKIALNQLSCNVSLDDPFLQKTLWTLKKHELKNMRRGKIELPDSGMYMASVVPTDCLAFGEAVLVGPKGTHECSRALIFRAPGLHFGDPHIVKLVYEPNLSKHLEKARNVLLFGIRGARSLPDEIAGGDLDGDMYYVITCPEVVDNYKTSDPFKSKPQQTKKDENSINQEGFNDQMAEKIIKVRFRPDMTMQRAAVWFEAWLDLYNDRTSDHYRSEQLVHDYLNPLVQTYYDALDADKTGATVTLRKELKPRFQPTHTERSNDLEPRESQSIGGQIYARVLKMGFNDVAWKPLNAEIARDEELRYGAQDDRWFSVGHKFLNRCKLLSTKVGKIMDENRPDKDEEIEKLYEDERKELYEGALYLEDSRRPQKLILEDASAIYWLCYAETMVNHAKKSERLSMHAYPWKVAWEALIKIKQLKVPPEDRMSATMSGLRACLGQNKEPAQGEPDL